MDDDDDMTGQSMDRASTSQPASPDPPADPSHRSAAAPASDRQISESDLLAGLDAPIEPVRVSMLYRLGLVVVAAAMVLLPLVYVGVVAAVGYGLYWHLTHNAVVFEQVSGRLALLAYVLPLIVGGIGLLFMIKPLFAPRPPRPQPVFVDARDEPLLFRYVEQLCQTVGAPMPRRIVLDAQVNASASFRRGIVSMFGRDLVLTIGMPLVAGLTLRQMTGVLAHEFGHFTQGTGMRLSYLISMISGWFARVVYERDAWDQKLVIWSQQAPHWAVQLALLIARFFVWLTRRLLWVLMWIGHLISCFMLRQMEYDADRYETRVAGSETFAATSKIMPLLAWANQGAHEALHESWREGRLGDDLPAMIMAKVGQLLSKHRQAAAQFEADVLAARTGFFDTHPSTRDRIDIAQREQAPGVFRLDAPARVLFGDFDRMCKAVTLSYYRQAIGAEFQPSGLVPTAALLKEQDRIGAARETLHRYFQGQLLQVQQVFLPAAELDAPADPHAAKQQLHQHRQAMIDHIPTARQAMRTWQEAEVRWHNARCALNLMRSELRVRAEDFELPKADRSHVEQVRQQAEGDRLSAMAQMDDFRCAAIGRLAAALRLIYDDAVGAHFKHIDEVRQRIGQLTGALAALESNWTRLLDLRDQYNIFALLMQNLEGNERNEVLINRILSRSEHITKAMRDIRIHLTAVPYPYKHATEAVSLGDYAAPKVSEAKSVGEVYVEADHMIQQLSTLYYRLMADLASVAEKVETAIGLPPLPDPPESADQN